MSRSWVWFMIVVAARATSAWADVDGHLVAEASCASRGLARLGARAQGAFTQARWRRVQGIASRPMRRKLVSMWQVLLRCPNYPGWSASCRRARLLVDCEQQEGLLVFTEISARWSKNWLGVRAIRGARRVRGSLGLVPCVWNALGRPHRASAQAQEALNVRFQAFFRLWAALSDDATWLSAPQTYSLGPRATETEAYLLLDASHLSLAGQKRQHVWAPKVVDHRSADSLLVRFEALATSTSLAPELRRKAGELLRKLARNEHAVGAPALEAERSAMYGEMTALVHRTLDRLDQQPEHFAAVAQLLGTRHYCKS